MENDKVTLRLPNGNTLVARADPGEGEPYPAIGIFLKRQGEKAEEEICFVEYNDERPEGDKLRIGAYCAGEDDIIFYSGYESGEYEV
jgi:hypothetical protein